MEKKELIKHKNKLVKRYARISENILCNERLIIDCESAMLSPEVRILERRIKKYESERNDILLEINHLNKKLK